MWSIAIYVSDILGPSKTGCILKALKCGYGGKDLHEEKIQMKRYSEEQVATRGNCCQLLEEEIKLNWSHLIEGLFSERNNSWKDYREKKEDIVCQRI